MTDARRTDTTNIDICLQTQAQIISLNDSPNLVYIDSI